MIVDMNKFRSIFRSGAVVMAMLMSAAFVLQSCEDDESSGPTSFTIVGEPTGLTAGYEGKTEKYTVRGLGAWKIVKKEEGDWVRIFPDEGDDDGIFEITVRPNTGFQPRVMNLAFVVNGEEQPVLFRIEQEADVPRLTAPEKIVFAETGGDTTLTLETNIPNWEYTLSDDSWLTEVSKTQDKLVLNATHNEGFSRTVTLTITAADAPHLNTTVTVFQLPSLEGALVFEEDFSWLSYGSAVPYVTTGERRYDLWTDDEKAKGWTSTINPVDGSGGQPLVYARQGFVKLGKTSYGGDLISPELSAIEGTKDVLVKFKGVAYLSAAGSVVDSRVLRIEVIGPGTPSVSTIMIENVPNTEAQDLAGVENDIWAEDRAFRFVIFGATAETKIKFLGKAYDLRNESPNTNRIFLDDIRVTLIE